MGKTFSITRRHYDIITKQAADNYPEESGGFLGGKDMVISAILPIHNLHHENRTDTFVCTNEDIQRAHEFFNKHGLVYFGLYHTHPNGIAEPSPQDISTGHRYHFIIAVHGKDPKQTHMRAFEVKTRVAHNIPLTILSKDAKPIDIHNPKNKAPITPEDPIFKEADQLSTLMDNIRNDEVQYPKHKPLRPDNSDFSTLA